MLRRLRSLPSTIREVCLALYREAVGGMGSPIGPVRPPAHRYREHVQAVLVIGYRQPGPRRRQLALHEFRVVERHVGRKRVALEQD